jgi:hypothetical protein
VVRTFELVFDDHGVSGLEVFPDEVEREPADAVLGGGQFKVHAQEVRQDIGVFEQPLGEVLRLVRPHLANWNLRYAAEIGQIGHMRRVGNSLGCAAAPRWAQVVRSEESAPLCLTTYAIVAVDVSAGVHHRPRGSVAEGSQIGSHPGRGLPLPSVVRIVVWKAVRHDEDVPLLPDSLTTRSAFKVVSTNSLCSSVAKQTAVTRDAIVPVPEMQTYITPAAPIHILHALGRATSSLPALSSAGVAGLPGLLALRLTSTWAVARYLWAFERGDPGFLLSAATDQVRQHGRSLFSEQLGIGFAIYLVENHLLEPWDFPMTVDIDAIFADPTIGPLIAPLDSHRPDYLIHTSPASGMPTLIVLEVKGNSGGRTQAVKQLGRAVEQVLTVPNVPGYNVRRLAIATVASRRRLTSYCIEVEVPGPNEWRRQLPRIRMRGTETRQVMWDYGEQFGVRPGDNLTDVPDELDGGTIRDAVEVGEEARLLTYAGIPVDLGEASRRDNPIGNRGQRLSTRLVDGRPYSGSTLRDEQGDSTLQIFAGVQSQLMEVLLKPERPIGMRDGIREVAREIGSDHAPAGIAAGIGLLSEVSITGFDGSALLVESN